MGFYTARWPGHEIIIIFFYSSSFTVALKNLKPFDTEEEKELVVGSALVSHTMNKKKSFPVVAAHFCHFCLWLV